MDARSPSPSGLRGPATRPILTSCAAASSHAVDSFDRITPETAGYSSEKLQALPPFLASAGSQSLLLLYDGKVFFEWGDIRKKILVHSIRKALLNGLMGTCYGEGRLDLDASLADLSIDDIAPSLTPPVHHIRRDRGLTCGCRGAWETIALSRQLDAFKCVRGLLGRRSRRHV